MNVTPWYEEAMRMASPEDHRKFEEWTGFLPKRLETTPYHSGPHSIRNFEMAYKLAGKPHCILEVGFCLGHSASIWLALGVDKVISLETSDRTQTTIARRRVEKKFGKMFLFWPEGSEAIMKRGAYIPEIADMAFIDGDHGIEAVDSDVRFILDTGIRYILFDDWFTHWSEGVQPAVEKHRLVPIAILGSMALCVPAKNLL